MNTPAYAQTYVVADAVFFDPVLSWLNSNAAKDAGWNFEWPLNDGVAVAVLSLANDDTKKYLILIDPHGAKPARIRTVLTQYTDGLSRLHIIAPGLIQYFASRINVNDPIFKAIDWLSNFPIISENAPRFDLADDSFAEGIDKFKCNLFVESTPRKKDSIKTNYITASGKPVTYSKLVDIEQLQRTEKIGSVNGHVAAEPIDENLSLVFYSRWISRTQYIHEHIIAFDRHKGDINSNAGNRGYAKLAYTLLMLLFPSREVFDTPKNNPPGFSEIARLCQDLNKLNQELGLQHTDFTEEDVMHITRHNRSQWDLARSLLNKIGFSLPETPILRKVKEENFNKFTHLVISNFATLQNRLALNLPELTYIGAPLLARNGMTCALGVVKDGENERCGFVRFGSDDTELRSEGFRFKDNPQYDIINRLLPQILSLEIDPVRDRVGEVVNQAEAS